MKKVTFPVFKLPDDNVECIDGLLLYGNLVIDDRNQPGDTLGKRRLQSCHELLRMRYTLPDVKSLVKYSNGNVFIDSLGKLFIYRKTIFTNVVYHKILKVTTHDNYSVIKLQGVSHPITVDVIPRPGMEWAGMLYYKDRPWSVYEYSETFQNPKRRKI